MRNFALGIPTCWYLKMLKLALPSMQILKFAFDPTRNTNASQWNIGCVGSPKLFSHVGHVLFMLFVLISFVLVTQRKPSLQWNMGFNPRLQSHKVSIGVNNNRHISKYS